MRTILFNLANKILCLPVVVKKIIGLKVYYLMQWVRFARNIMKLQKQHLVHIQQTVTVSLLLAVVVLSYLNHLNTLKHVVPTF
ncbi:hypothetical protein D9M71_781700 [compost metagenome]